MWITCTTYMFSFVTTNYYFTCTTILLPTKFFVNFLLVQNENTKKKLRRLNETQKLVTFFPCYSYKGVFLAYSWQQDGNVTILCYLLTTFFFYLKSHHLNHLFSTTQVFTIASLILLQLLTVKLQKQIIMLQYISRPMGKKWRNFQVYIAQFYHQLQYRTRN